tara:strand:+ start:429 stop:659 length:231 start_codon:yes stop_codon:yes gene_type:complete
MKEKLLVLVGSFMFTLGLLLFLRNWIIFFVFNIDIMSDKETWFLLFQITNLLTMGVGLSIMKIDFDKINNNFNRKK